MSVIANPDKQYLPVGERHTLTLHCFGDVLYYGDKNLTTSSYEGTVSSGGTVAITTGRWIMSAGQTRVEISDNNPTNELDPFGGAQGPPGPSSVPSVSDYGAVGDGTTDDTAAFQDALDDGVGGVHVPAGTFKLLGNITVPAGTRLYGTGSGSVVKTDSQVVAKSATEIDHLRFETITSLARDATTNLPTAEGVRALVYFYDAPNTLVNCKAHDLTGDGLEIAFFKVLGFECHSNHFWGGWYGAIGEQESGNGQIHNNNVKFSNADGITFYGGNTHHVQGNVSDQHRKSGFFSYGDVSNPTNGGASRLTFINNEAAYSVEEAGFDINSDSPDTMLRQKFIGNSAHDNNGEGIFAPGSGHIIHDNHVYRNGETGIRVSYDPNVGARAPSTQLSIKNNVCYDNNVQANVGNGLDFNIFVDWMRDSQVTGNICIQPAAGEALTASLYVAEGKNSVIADNIAVSYRAADSAANMFAATPETGKFFTVRGNRGTAADSLSSPYTWTALPLLNGWANYGSGFAPAGYYKDDAGRVYLRGLIVGGTTTAGTSLFTLPDTHWPAFTQDFAVPSAQAFGMVRFAPTSEAGQIQAGTATLALDGISFLTV